MKFSVCIDALFNGKDFYKSMGELKEIGMGDFEFWSWWDKDLNRIIKEKKRLDMNVVAFCTKFISLTDSRAREAYKEGLGESIEIAKKLDCNMLISQVGDEIPGFPRGKQYGSIVEGLKQCTPMLEEAGITLVFEPLNTIYDHKGYYLYSSEEAFRISNEVDSPYVKVLYDIYHQQVMEGNIINNIKSNIDKIGHFHAAGHPGRKEILTGEINYPEIFKSIEEAGYTKHMGLEYFPSGKPIEGLVKCLKI